MSWGSLAVSTIVEASHWWPRQCNKATTAVRDQDPITKSNKKSRISLQMFSFGNDGSINNHPTSERRGVGMTQSNSHWHSRIYMIVLEVLLFPIEMSRLSSTEQGITSQVGWFNSSVHSLDNTVACLRKGSEGFWFSITFSLTQLAQFTNLTLSKKARLFLTYEAGS